MITAAFLSIAYSLLSWLINLLPAGGTFPAEVHSAAVGLGGYLGILSPIAPISTLSTVLLLIISVELTIFGFRTFRWVVSHIPFIGGKGA